MSDPPTGLVTVGKIEPLLLIFDMINQQDFCIKMVMVHSGLGRGKGVHILLRGIYAVPFIHRNTNRVFFRLSGADWGWDM